MTMVRCVPRLYIAEEFSQFTRVAILFHFLYFMCSTYRIRSCKFSTNKLILKYAVFIFLMTTIYAVVTITSDLSLTRSAFITKNGYCATQFLNKDSYYTIYCSFSINSCHASSSICCRHGTVLFGQ